MPIVICGGSSVTDFHIPDLAYLCSRSFVFAVNDSAFYFPCDVVVAMDFNWIRDNADKLKKLDKYIITRESDVVKNLGLNLSFIPNESVLRYPLSGMLAAKISDMMAEKVGRKSYVFGMDGTSGHYYDDKGRAEVISMERYKDLNLTSTINMSVRSRIPYWPKKSKLPKLSDVLIHDVYHAVGTGWACGNPSALI